MLKRCYLFLSFGLFTVVCGCAETEPLDVSTELETTTGAAETIEKSIVVSDVPVPPAVEGDLVDTKDESQQVAAEYVPPYPDRVDLFLAPKREGMNKIQDDSGAVELLGFVNVDQHRAVLMINGTVYPIAEGDSRFGIEVISIQPPGVVLQRGRQRWQATLEN